MSGSSLVKWPGIQMKQAVFVKNYLAEATESYASYFSTKVMVKVTRSLTFVSIERASSV